MTMILCLAIAIHDVDGPIRCATGENVRLRGIGALELDGTRRGAQPSVPGDPFDQRRRMAAAIGADVATEDRQHLWFVRPVPLHCEVTGKSYRRLVAWCRTDAGQDMSCLAVRAGVALRWARFDPTGRLAGCRPPAAAVRPCADAGADPRQCAGPVKTRRRIPFHQTATDRSIP